MTTEVLEQPIVAPTTETAQTQAEFEAAWESRSSFTPVEEAPVEEAPEEVVESKVEDLGEPAEDKPVEEVKEEPVHMRTKKALQLLETERAASAAAKAEAAALRAEIEALKKGTAPAPVLVATPQGAPRLEDYAGDTEKFVDAMTNFKLAQALSARQAAEAEQNRVVKFIAEGHEDFNDEVQIAMGEIKAGIRAAWNQDIINVCQEGENGVALQYHLMKNPEVVDRLNALPPIKRMLELGRLEGTLTAPAVKVEQKTSKAPAPVSKASGAAPVNKTLAEAGSQAEFEAAFRKKYGRL